MPHAATTDRAIELAVSPKTAARLLSASASSLEKDRATGHLGIPYVKAGKRVMYLMRDLYDWLEMHKVNPTLQARTGE